MVGRLGSPWPRPPWTRTLGSSSVENGAPPRPREPTLSLHLPVDDRRRQRDGVILTPRLHRPPSPSPSPGPHPDYGNIVAPVAGGRETPGTGHGDAGSADLKGPGPGRVQGQKLRRLPGLRWFGFVQLVTQQQQTAMTGSLGIHLGPVEADPERGHKETSGA